MVNKEYKPLAANREGILRDPPGFTDLVNMVDDIKAMSTEERAWYGIAVLTGARVSEIINLKFKDIKVYAENDKLIDPKETNGYQSIASNEISKIVFSMINEKNKKQKFKNIPVLNYDLFNKPVSWVFFRLKELGYNPDQKVVSYSRGKIWFMVKKHFGKNFFPHFFRHCAVSQDTRAGIPVAIQKAKYGWTDTRPHEVYAHLNISDLENAMRKIYGPKMEKYYEATGAKGNYRSVEDRPLTKNQILGGYIAATEVAEEIRPPFNQKVSILENEAGQRGKMITTPNIRRIRDKILSNTGSTLKLKQNVKKTHTGGDENVWFI